MKLFRTICMTPILLFCLSAGYGYGHFDHSIYDSLLKTHVTEGLVDYSALKQDPSLDQYLALIAQADLGSLATRNEQLAFWTNAYNAYTLKLITINFPLDSIMDIKEEGYESPWDIPLVKVAGKQYTLDQIENEIIRPKFKDPRIHYALVCAARSCPKLRNEAYVGVRLEEQFEEQSRWFMIHRNTFDQKSKVAKLSSVFDWYSVDFGENIQETLKWIIPYVEPSLANSLKQHPKSWEISFSEWDWRLNIKK